MSSSTRGVWRVPGWWHEYQLIMSPQRRKRAFLPWPIFLSVTHTHKSLSLKWTPCPFLLKGTLSFKCFALSLMIESYLGQENTFLWKVFVNSCEDNLSPKLLVAPGEGGKYCTCSHVFECLRMHRHKQSSRHTKFSDTHITHTDTWPLAVGQVHPLISVTPVIKSVSIFLTSASQQCEYVPRYLLSCSSFPPVIRIHAHKHKLNCLFNNLPTRVCCTLEVNCKGFLEVIQHKASINNLTNRHTFSLPIDRFQNSYSQSQRSQKGFWQARSCQDW